MTGMLVMVILVGIGEKMAERFLPIYLLALGGGIISVGVLNGMDNLLSALYSLPGGYLSDKIGFKRALLVFNIMTIAGFAVVILIPTWYSVLAGSVLFLSWTAISLPASMSLVSVVLPKNKRIMGVSMHSLVRRIPMALGPLIGGFFIVCWGEVNGVRMAFVAAAFMAVVAAVFQQMLIEDKREELKNEQKSRPFILLRKMDRSLKILLVSDILVRFCEQIPYAFVVIWVMKTIPDPISAFQFGILTVVEMATAMIIYIPVAYFADRNRKKPFVAATFAIFTAFPVVMSFSTSFWACAAAFVLRGMKEFGEPTRKALIMELSPEGQKAASFGLYYLIRDVFVSIAAFGGAFLWQVSPYANFSAAALFGVAGTLWFLLFGKDV
ncbi:MFS transporter [candidate division WOR-3 bacterium]|nr:MFS transporter [candidate division WOR-3 bacterium]